MPVTKVQNGRFQINESLSEEEIKFLVECKELKFLQCAGKVYGSAWERLNNLLFSQRPEVNLRVYGFYSSYDLTFLKQMSNVQDLEIDGLMNATGIESISALKNLKSLSISIYNLDNFDFLSDIPEDLEVLGLGATRSKKPTLDLLARFKNLKKVYIEGHQKNIEILGTLKNLEDVTLRSITTNDLSYLMPLKKMWSLDIKLGGITNLEALRGMTNIKYLELWQIRKLSDISVISSLTGLQYLFLQSLSNVTTLPDFKNLTNLRRILLDNMKGLLDISSLEFCPSLEEFIHYAAKNMEPEDYLPLLNNPSLKQVLCGVNSKKKFNMIKEMAEQREIHQWDRSEFGFI
jgi:hypothetical protein